METIILRGDSKSNAKLLQELAKKLNFSAKKLSAKEAEEICLYYSIKEENSPIQYKGAFTREKAMELVKQLEKSREEWDEKAI